VPSSIPAKTITPHIWYMNALLVRTANAYLAMSMDIFIIAPVFLLISWELLRGLASIIGVLICLVSMGRTAWYCGWIYYHFFGHNRIRIFAEAAFAQAFVPTFSPDSMMIPNRAVAGSPLIRLPMAFSVEPIPGSMPRTPGTAVTT